MHGEEQWIVELAAQDAAALLSGRHACPHDFLGCRLVDSNGRKGLLFRALHPDATGAVLHFNDQSVELRRLVHKGLFGAFLPDIAAPSAPRVTFSFEDGATWTIGDPYSHWPTLGEQDLYLFGQGTHYRIWEVMGARAREHQGVWGTAFSVWAPNAAAVSLVSDFNGWDRRLLPMRSMGSSGVWELFVPGLTAGTRYQFDILTHGGEWLRKADPYAELADRPPGRASVVTERSAFAWSDQAYMASRTDQDLAAQPMNVYEVHLASYKRQPDGRPWGYRALADHLVPHMERFGFTHLELLPIAEHPFDGSWGYQVTGFFAPTTRFGTPDDFRYLVDCCHRRGIGVIVDWVPAHFPKDDFALARFDGTALYEHADPRQGEHPDWGTLIFNYGRTEVSNFLIGSALYFLSEFHVDGLRVDAVASMLYLDYSRQAGEWVPNAYGGRENLDAINFIRHLTNVIRERVPGSYCIAEESTAWGGVTGPTEEGGLGFAFKWNMGWMHDTLLYFSKDPYHRRYHQNDLTFASVYENSERFLMPLSHDEVVHGKGSLLQKMPGDRWQKFANLRALYAYQYTRPGKKLLFMGSEFAPEWEWNYAAELPWPAEDDQERQAFMRFVAALGHFYRESPALYVDGPDSFSWIDTQDHEQSVLSFSRSQGEQRMVVIMNLTPVPRERYRIGASSPGRYHMRLNTDAKEFGGSGFPTSLLCDAEPEPMHGCNFSICLNLPPLAVVVLVHEALQEYERADRLGIAEAFYTIDGALHVTDGRTRRFLLDVLEDAGPERPPEMLAEAAQARQDGSSGPLRVWSMGEAVSEGRAVGLWTQLYTLRSERSWGIGDFGDLQRLLQWCGSCGMDFVGLNPLHAMPFNANPAVPYHPWTRLFDTPLYIDVAAVPEYQRLGDGSEFNRRREGLVGKQVDYPAVWVLKRDALRAAFDALQAQPDGCPRKQALQAFVEAEGEDLHSFAVFCAMQDERLRQGEASGSVAALPPDCRSWDAPGTARFVAGHGQEIAFFTYLQFLVDEQLRACADAARQAGMRIGLYLDLAVGAGHGGYDTWSYPRAHVEPVSLGAPPDALAPQGQDWGLSPLHPLRLRSDNYRLLRQVLRRAMRHAGALRIDHAMGMTRQFWIPRGGELPGTYVRFPCSEILDVIAEESRKAQCLVVAEDLGTVPEGFRPEIQGRGLLRYEVLQFSRGADGSYPSPAGLVPQALACMSTHDLPTFTEYWSGDDLRLRQRMGLFTVEQLKVQQAGRLRDREALCAWLAAHGHGVTMEDAAEVVLRAAHKVLVSGSSALVALSLDDLVGEPHAVNVPGTRAEDGFVSFARRMERDLASLEQDQGLREHLQALRALVDQPQE